MRKYLRFNIVFTVLCTVLLTTQVGISFSQEFDDVEVVTVPLTNMFTTRFGYIVTYTSSALYNENVYIPREWFLKESKNKKPDETDRVYGLIKATEQNIGVPLLKITYVNKKMKTVTLIIKKSSYAKATSSLLPDDYHKLDLEPLFNEQRESGILIIK